MIFWDINITIVVFLLILTNLFYPLPCVYFPLNADLRFVLKLFLRQRKCIYMNTQRGIRFIRYYISCCLLFFAAAPVLAVEFNGVSAVPDYGRSDCISFKKGNSTNPLSFTFGYACASESTCEVFSHGCADDYCDTPDYSKGTRTSLTSISVATPVNQISMAASGQKLKESGQWCLIQDGAGNHWALDKWRGTRELFSLDNQSETVVPCKLTDTFSSHLGCIRTNNSR